MSKLKLFLFSKNGVVALASFILFAIVSNLNTYNPWINFLARVGNFAIFIYILWGTLGKNLVGLLSRRRQDIVATLNDLKEQKQKLEIQLLDIEKRSSNVEAEKKALFAKYQSQTDALRAQVASETKEKIARIDSQTQNAIEALSKDMLQKLYKKIANEVISSLEIELKKNIDATKQYALINNALKKVGAFD